MLLKDLSGDVFRGGAPVGTLGSQALRELVRNDDPQLGHEPMLPGGQPHSRHSVAPTKGIRHVLSREYPAGAVDQGRSLKFTQSVDLVFSSREFAKIRLADLPS
jgi:hypothetical protein